LDSLRAFAAGISREAKLDLLPRWMPGLFPEKSEASSRA
jgi:hypothetical protein